MEKIKDLLEFLHLQTIDKSAHYKPLFLKLSNPTDKQQFSELLKLPGISVSDFIESQFADLIKVKQTSRKFTPEELATETKKLLDGKDKSEYGVWVYYSWSNRLVHMLDKDDFIKVRTSRNHYKITPQEQDELSTKKIGVIGLSVGQSVALTLVMERVCGEIRLADFDFLELTNLNRIRTGVHNLGLPKVFSVAREIAEIDPFIKVVCFPEGINDTTIEAFFCDGGKLDLMIEESDGFDIKILSRYKARELGVPVLMEASDRCMVDVERFDLEPQRDVLHGLVNHLDVATLKELKTNEQKIPYMLDVLGVETASLRLKASMLEIEQSINTWPQLASAVTMGGGITADVARRILLNQFSESGRYFVDIEELIGDNKSSEAKIQEPQKIDSFDFLDTAMKVKLPKTSEWSILPKSEIESIVSVACLAPSGGNSQPWRWVYKQNELLLFNAFDGNRTMLGFENLPSYVAMGAAIENIFLKAGELQYKIHCRIFPDNAIKDLVAIIGFQKSEGLVKEQFRRAEFIEMRLTNRNLGRRETIEPEVLKSLQSAASEIKGAELRFFTSDDDLQNIGDVLGEVEKIRLLEEMGHKDFVDEIRWTPEENDAKRDGVDLRTLDITNAERVGLQVSKDKRIIDLIKQWNGGGAFKKLTKKSIDAAGAVGVLCMKDHSYEDYIKGGQALQKIWLDANSMGLAFQPMASSLFIYARLFRGNGTGLSDKGVQQLKDLRPRFESSLGLSDQGKEIFIFRLSKTSEPQVKSLRKPLKDVFKYL